ncbi:MAG: ERF family protein [Lachnospiraceae bacterium]|nr:ERF family protein [Lachnospiraceae bacterium]
MCDKKIYESINAIQSALAKTGISKDRKNQQQGYAFRGIDDVYGALAPLLAQHGVCVFPRVTERQCIERQTQRGGALFYVTVRVEFDFVSSVDGSSHTCITYGEAMDSADKATNKAMSAAYKYACLQTFCIPTDGDNDADATTHDVAPRPQPALMYPTVDEFREMLSFCQSEDDIKTLLNKQRGNPQLSQLVPLATVRKNEIAQLANGAAIDGAINQLNNQPNE